MLEQFTKWVSQNAPESLSSVKKNGKKLEALDGAMGGEFTKLLKKNDSFSLDDLAGLIGGPSSGAGGALASLAGLASGKGKGILGGILGGAKGGSNLQKAMPIINEILSNREIFDSLIKLYQRFVKTKS